MVDSEQLSSGMGFLIMSAAQLADRGFSTEEILAHVEELKSRISNSFIAPSVEPLIKKGKISYPVYRICALLDLHPVLTLKKGEMVLSGVYRGSMDRSYTEYIRSALQGKKNIDTELLFITYAGCSARQLKEFQNRVGRYQQFKQITLQKTSATISGNCGLGAMGIAYVKKKKEPPKQQFW